MLVAGRGGKFWLQLGSVMLLESEAAPTRPCVGLSVCLSAACSGLAPSTGQHQELKERRAKGMGGGLGSAEPPLLPLVWGEKQETGQEIGSPLFGGSCHPLFLAAIGVGVWGLRGTPITPRRAAGQGWV